MKLRLGVRLAANRCTRTVEVGLNTQDRRVAEYIAAIVTRILSMTGVGTSVWRLRDETGAPLDPELITEVVNSSREITAEETARAASAAPAPARSRSRRRALKKKATQQGHQLCFAFLQPME